MRGRFDKCHRRNVGAFGRKIVGVVFFGAFVSTLGLLGVAMLLVDVGIVIQICKSSVGVAQKFAHAVKVAGQIR